MAQAGKGATVLIHEATFEASKAQEAVERRHSTVDEALDVARRMGAASVLLTHFRCVCMCTCGGVVVFFWRVWHVCA
jgi:ribonuclease BN (tRNA processing enzyme)